MQIRALLVFLVSVLFPTISFSQQPTVLYVNRTDPACAGHSPCYKSMQAAVNAAQPGNIVRIQGGTYSEQVRVTNKNSVAGSSELHRIVIEADPAAAEGAVILRGSGSGGDDDDDGCGDDDGRRYGFRIRNSRYITIRGLSITNVSGPGVWLAPSGDDDDDDGQTGTNRAIHIELNRIYGNSSSTCNGGIVVSGGHRGTLIANNLVYANGRHGIAFEGSSGGPHYVINNTIYRNQRNGIEVSSGQEIHIVNNIVNNNGTASGTSGGRYGIRRQSSSNPQPQKLRLLNNLICGNTQGEINGPVLDAADSGNLTPLGKEGAGVSARPGCQISANVFVNLNGADNRPSTGDDDFRLSSNSPALDNGIDSRNLGLDPLFNSILEGDYYIDLTRPKIGKRGNQAQFDIGAHEYIIPNQPPVANAGQSKTVPAGTVTNLDGTASYDPDGDALTYKWAQTVGPSVALSNPTSTTPIFTAPAVQTPIGLTFELKVEDGLASDSASVNVTVIKPNQPPLLTPIGNKSINVGQTLKFTVSATDPDNDPLTYSVSPMPLPANASFDAGSRGFTFTPAASQVGSHSLTFAVNDGRGGTASETTAISVTAALAINITSPANGATVAAGQLLVRGTISNSSGGEVGVTVNGIPAAVQSNTFMALMVVTPDITTLAATATSGAGATANQVTAITVSGSASSDLSLRAKPFRGPAPLIVDFSLSSDAAVTQLSLDANSDGIVDYTGPQLNQMSFRFNQPGVYLASATVTTAQGSQVTASALVQVFDRAQLDAILRAKWAAMKDALRIGNININVALSEIAQRARSRYQEGFQIITPQLSNIDQILPDVTLVEFRENEAIYGATRMDGGIPIAFEVRFVVDGDGIWRVRSF